MLLDLSSLVQQCAPTVSPVLMQALVRKESGFNPYAIGVHSGEQPVKQQPRSLDEAVQVAKSLEQKKIGFSVGLGQLSIGNVKAWGMNWEQAFDACQNLGRAQVVLWDFYRDAVRKGYRDVEAVYAALRGYNSGDVHKAVSNEYASTIFKFMNQPSPAVTVSVSNVGKVASVSARLIEEWEGNSGAEGQAREAFESGGGKEGF